MGWQGYIAKRSTLDRVAALYGLSWHEILVKCWRDNDAFWVFLPDGRILRHRRETLERDPHDMEQLTPTA